MRTMNKRGCACLALAMMLALALVLQGFCAAEEQAASSFSSDKGLEVYFLDLGRVDGILIRCDGETSFMDVGFKEDAPEAIRYLEALGVEKLDSYIGSHAHADHVAGAAQIIDRFKPDTLYLNRINTLSVIIKNGTDAQERSVRAAQAVYLTAGDSFSIGGAMVRCLGPASIKEVSTADTAENDNSLILRLDYGSRSFLFTGDTSDDMLRRANSRYPGGLDVDVLKNPHHNGPHNRDVVRMISPAITVFCTDNSHLPGSGYRSLLRSQGSAYYITGSNNDGNVAVVSDGESLEVRCGYPMTTVEINEIQTMYPGQICAVTGTLEPKALANPQKWLNWKTSDPNVLLVSGGRIKAVGEGTATLTATAFNGVSAKRDVRVLSAGVILETYAISMSVGEEARLRAKIMPEGVAGVTGEFISEDESIVIVTEKGEILAAREGSTRVIARLSNGAQAACAITVSGVKVDSISLDMDKAIMKEGKQLTLTAEVTPAYASGVQLEWRSSDESVVWVDQYGVVTAVGPGIASVGVGAPNGVYAVCMIKVEP